MGCEEDPLYPDAGARRVENAWPPWKATVVPAEKWVELTFPTVCQGVDGEVPLLESEPEGET